VTIPNWLFMSMIFGLDLTIRTVVGIRPGLRDPTPNEMGWH
jgi:hypothetical protein